MIRRAVAVLAGGCALAACGLSLEGMDAAPTPGSDSGPPPGVPLEAGVEAGVDATADAGAGAPPCVRSTCVADAGACWADDCSSDTRWGEYSGAIPRENGVCGVKVPTGSHTGRRVLTATNPPDDFRFDLFFEVTEFRTAPGSARQIIASVGTGGVTRFTWLAITDTKVSLCQADGSGERCVDQTVTKVPRRYHYFGTIRRSGGGAGGTVTVEDADDASCGKVVEASVTGSFADGAWYAYVGCLGDGACDYTWDNAVFEISSD